METPSAGPRRQVLLVLGMHRGGTSATAGLLAQLGAAWPRTPDAAPTATTPTATGNRRSSACTTGCSPRPAAAGTTGGRSTPRPRRRRRASERCRRARSPPPSPPSSGRRRWARGAQGPAHLPLPAALAGGARRPRGRAGAVLPLRHPLEVADSLARRDGMPRRRRCCSGSATCSRPRPATRAMPRAFLRYDDLVADWRAVADRLAATLGIVWPVSPEAAAPAIAAFSAATCATMPPTPAGAGLPAPGSAEGWAALVALAEGDGRRPRLDALRAALDAGDALMGVAARRQAAAPPRPKRAARAATEAAAAHRRGDASEAAAAPAAARRARAAEASGRAHVRRGARDRAPTASPARGRGGRASCAGGARRRGPAAESGRAAEAAARGRARGLPRLALLAAHRAPAPRRRPGSGRRRGGRHPSPHLGGDGPWAACGSIRRIASAAPSLRTGAIRPYPRGTLLCRATPAGGGGDPRVWLRD